MAQGFPLPLSGIKVLDISKVLAGPLCAQYLAEMGAEVIKVEPPGTGDDTRLWPPFRAPGIGAVFMSANRGKRSIAVDLKTPEGRAIVHELVRQADVAIESFGTGTAERLGVDRATLMAINPRLIHCGISGFGRSGPLRNAPGYDVILQAFSGMMSLTGEEDSGFIRSPVSPIDQTTGIHALTGILAALYARRATGQVEFVEVSLYDTALGLLGYNLQSFWERGVQPERCGSSHESLCPYQAFEAADGAVMIGVANDSLWRKFCVVAGLDHLAEDPRFARNPDRVANRGATVALVAEAIRERPVNYWDEELARVRVPCSPINDLKSLLAHPHTQQADIVIDYDASWGEGLRGIAQPVRFSGRRRKAVSPPPSLGQNSADVLREIGRGESEIDDLRSRGVIS